MTTKEMQIKSKQRREEVDRVNKHCSLNDTDVCTKTFFTTKRLTHANLISASIKQFVV